MLLPYKYMPCCFTLANRIRIVPVLIREWTLAVELPTSWPEDKCLPLLRDLGQLFNLSELHFACSVKGDE